MASTIIINRAFGETRVALLEDGSAAEFYVERDHDLGLVGNIYKGRVTRVLPGMQAAFVDIGLDRAAFLYVDDVVQPGAADGTAVDSADDADALGETVDADSSEDLGASTAEAPSLESNIPTKEPRVAIGDVLHEGQDLLCQVSKDPLGTKGARVTAQISFAGRYVVFMPTTTHIGISKRITDDEERKRLKELVAHLRGDSGGGFIVRTEAFGIDAAKLKEDMDFVRSLSGEVDEANGRSPPRSLLLADLDLVLRAVRDLFTRDVERLIVDNDHEFRRIQSFLAKFGPHLIERVALFDGTAGLFDHFGVEGDLERGLARKVTMKSGASIVIDQAEALTAIDVNTGRFVGKQNLEATILRTNLEAVREIVSQLRLRNIGGIIVIDFIDMSSAENRELVYQAFLEELKRDRAKTHVLPISELGVIEMTRKRVRESLGRRLTEPCPYCEGRGRIRSRMTVCHDILREIVRQARRNPDADLVVSANPEIAAMLTEDKIDVLTELEASMGRSVIVEARNDYHQEAFRVSATSASRGAR